MSLENRFLISKERKSITVRIKTPKNWFLLIVGPIWLTFWTIGGYAAINAVLRGTHDWFFYIFWLGGWVVGEIAVSVSILWTAFGEEIISVRDGTFEHVRHVFGLGRRRTFPLKKLSRLRTQGPFPKLNSFRSFFRGVFSPTIAVDMSHGRTYKFGLDLDKNSATYLVTELKPYFDESSDQPDPLRPKLEW